MIENEYRVIGPPGCIAGDSLIQVNRAGITRKYRMDYLVERFNSAVPGGFFRGNGYAKKTTTKWDSDIPTMVRSLVDDRVLLAPVVAAVRSGVKPVVRLAVEGEAIDLTADHRVLTKRGMVRVDSLFDGDLIATPGITKKRVTASKRSYLCAEGLKHHPHAGRVLQGRFSVLVHRLAVEANMNSMSLEDWIAIHRSGSICGELRYLHPRLHVHHIDGNHKNNSISNLSVVSSSEHSLLHCAEGGWKRVVCGVVYRRLISIHDIGETETYDLTVGHPSGHGNYVANGIIVSNCGKTTYLADQVQRRVDAFCTRTKMMPMHCTEVLVASLTRAAAAEVHSRNIKIPHEQVGTLHSHCYRALGSPQLCVTPKAIRQWNEECGDDRYHLTGASASLDEEGEDDSASSGGVKLGDRLLGEYGVNRSRLIPVDGMYGELRDFARRYERWKYTSGLCDYHDLIDTCYQHDVRPPGNPSVILSDETQDNDKAEFRLLRKWARGVSKLIMVADPDQAIFEWRGADPQSFYSEEIPDGHTKVLEQSYRVPRAVHAAAMQMIERVSDRVSVSYYPTKEPGEVSLFPGSLRNGIPEIIDDIERILSETDKDTVMILAPCSYQLNQIRSHLRGRGIPYWNPYATGRQNFNPLHPSNGVPLLSRLRAYMIPQTHDRVWTYNEFYVWSTAMDSKGWLRRGAKQEIDRRAKMWPDEMVDLEFLGSIIDADAMQAMSDIKIEWFVEHASSRHQGLLDYIVTCINRFGFDNTEKPRVTVGTIHSVKGGEADHVYLAPDLSSSGWELYGNNPDQLYRMFYVGMTRSANRLNLLAPSGGMAMPWEGLL